MNAPTNRARTKLWAREEVKTLTADVAAATPAPQPSKEDVLRSTCVMLEDSIRAFLGRYGSDMASDYTVGDMCQALSVAAKRRASGEI